MSRHIWRRIRHAGREQSVVYVAVQYRVVCGISLVADTYHSYAPHTQDSFHQELRFTACASINDSRDRYGNNYSVYVIWHYDGHAPAAADVFPLAGWNNTSLHGVCDIAENKVCQAIWQFIMRREEI